MLIRGPSRGTRVQTRLSGHSKFPESLEDEVLQMKAFFTIELPSKRYPNEKLHPLGEGNGVCNGPLNVVSVDVGVAEAHSGISPYRLAGEHRIRISVLFSVFWLLRRRATRWGQATFRWRTNKRGGRQARV